MKRIYILPIMIIVLMTFTGCATKTVDNSGYQIYYTNANRTMLLSANYVITKEEPLEIVQEIWDKMRDPGNAAEQYSLIPEKLEAVKWDLTDGQLTVTFNAEYINMEKLSEVMLRAAFVEAATQLPEIKTVAFHIGNDVLRNSRNEPIGAMSRSNFINNPVGINSYQHASLTLYFASNDGNSVVREVRDLHYSTNITLPKVVMEQLLKGPMTKNLRNVFSDDVKVLDIYVDDKSCTVNLNKAFLQDGEDLSVKPEVVIYSIVNTLCDVLEIDRVQFQIDGDSNVKYAGELSFSGPFHRNSSLITTLDNTASDEDSKELVEPQIGL